jgi:carbon monoxide dehydrogenase subunit G
MPSSSFEHTINVDAPAAAVWDRLQDPEVWTALGPVQEVWDPVIEDGVLISFSWSTDIGGTTYEGTGSAVSANRPDRYDIALDTSQMKGTIGVALSPANQHRTDVNVTVELEPKGLLSSMFFPIVSRAIGDGLPDQVDALAASLTD